jgi:alkylation response protein AidB-like acyl-CoA dehydrogenase
VAAISGDPVAAARALVPLLESRRAETEALRRLPPDVVEALRDAGLFRLSLASELGGAELDPRRTMQVATILAAAEPAVAWNVWNNQLVCLFARYLGDAACARVFGDPRFVYANTTRPAGRVQVEPDGSLRVTGRWPLVSGCELADWIVVRGVLHDGDRPRMLAPQVPEARLLLLPRAAIRVVDTWRSVGLRGTGSHDIEVVDAHCPAELAFDYSGPLLRAPPLYRMPLLSTLAAVCAAMALGIADRSLGTLAEIAGVKVPLDGTPRLRDRGSVQLAMATGTARVGASRALLEAAIDESWRFVSDGGSLPDATLARTWLAATQAVAAARDVVTACYLEAGATALYENCWLERAFRDVHAMSQHIIVAPNWQQEAGRVLLGLEPASPLFRT